MKLLSTAVGRLRIMSLLDATSYIYLLYCALYLKRYLGDDTAIRLPGMIHGILFTIFCFTLLHAMLDKNWSFKTAFLIGLSSIVPFLPFWVEKWLKEQDNKA